MGWLDDLCNGIEDLGHFFGIGGGSGHGGSSTPPPPNNGILYIPPTISGFDLLVGATPIELDQSKDLATDGAIERKKKGRVLLRNDLTNTTGALLDPTSQSGINIL